MCCEQFTRQLLVVLAFEVVLFLTVLVVLVVRLWLRLLSLLFEQFVIEQDVVNTSYMIEIFLDGIAFSHRIY